MRISALLLRLTALAGATTAVAAGAARTGIFVAGEEQLVRRGDGDDDRKIPGDSPLELCPKDHEGDLITIQSVDLLPNPPLAGETLMIKAIGTVHDTIEEGAYVLLQVKYGLIRLISTKADLCEQIQNVDMECPIEKGVVSILKTVDLPSEIPPGKYTVFADVYSKDDVPITCLQATVVFGVHKLSDYVNIEL